MKQLIQKTLLLILLTICCWQGSMAQKYMPMSMSRSLSTRYAYNDANIKMSIDYPARDEGKDKLGTAIRTWLNEHIKSACNISDSAKISYDGDIQDGNSLIRFYEKAFIDLSVKDFIKYARSGRDSTNALHYQVKISAQVIYETEALVSYQLSSYSYLAGAHGAESIYYAIFRKVDGHILTWTDIMKTGAMSNFNRLLADGVVKYLKADNLEAAKKTLFIDKKTTADNFPLPLTNPGLKQDGLVGIYQNYEIGPYAMGHPEVTIPLTALRPIVKPLIWATIQPWK